MATTTGVIDKQPDEVLNISFDFTNALNTGASLTTIVSVIEATGDITITNEEVSSPNVTMTIAGGTTATRYKITVLVNTSDGEVLEADAVVKVKDR